MSDTTQPTLTIADLNSLKTIVEISTQRGAFRANELTSIGVVYDKLANFVAQAAAANEEAAQESQESKE